MRGKLVMVAATAVAMMGAGTAHATIDAAFLSPFMAMPAADTGGGAQTGGEFSQPFVEPDINGKPTDQKCVTQDGSPRPANPALGPPGDARYLDCKPTAASVNVLPDGRVMYYDGLEGTEQVRTSIVIEYGHNAGNDQSRVLDLGDGHPTWTIPGHADGGANPDGYANQALFPPPLSDDDPSNDGALFCSDNKFLPDGRVISLGGTAYYTDPGVGASGSNYGVSELEGLKNSRIFDPTANDGRGDWKQSGSMAYGRWYPTAVTLPSGKLLVASGVTKLLKPAYPDHPMDSGTNVTETETYEPVTGKWTANPSSASRDLPLFPRLHLLPDGKVFYNAAGQSFNPAGQSYGEASWNEAAVYDPHSQSWSDLGIPGLESAPSPDPSDLGNPAGDAQGYGIPGFGPSVTIPGFRGSTFSIMLPLTPGNGYSKASFLTAGGVLNPPSPGSYFATSDSRITTVDTKAGDAMSTRPTGDLGEPRWYASGVLLPTGQVLAFNGSDRDEVAGPGFEFPVQKTELFDPATNRWTTLASSHQPRTYHNTAALLPDGRVLVGGHAPISTLYANDTTVPGGFAPHDGRDPSFELYSPPYLFNKDGSRATQPTIENDDSAFTHLDYGQPIHINLDIPAAEADSVVMVRNPSVTHLIDADQRNVVLPITSRDGHDVTVTAPPSPAVAPPGPYLLFVMRKGDNGPVPSRSRQAYIGLDLVQ